MRLLVTDYSKDTKLSEAINRYFTLLHMTFASNLYKIYETPTSQIYKFLMQMVPPPQTQKPAEVEVAELEIECNGCHSRFKVQANLGRSQPIRPGSLAFPADNKLRCPRCGVEHDLSDTRRQLQAQAKKRVV
jgi:hypothetical protein